MPRETPNYTQAYFKAVHRLNTLERENAELRQRVEFWKERADRYENQCSDNASQVAQLLAACFVDGKCPNPECNEESE